jgi:hypothetical protein
MGFLLSLKRLKDIRSERIQWENTLPREPSQLAQGAVALRAHYDRRAAHMARPRRPHDAVAELRRQTTVGPLARHFHNPRVLDCLMFVVAGIKRAIVWLWRTLRRRTEPAMDKTERDRGRAADDWSEAEKETFKNWNKPPP